MCVLRNTLCITPFGCKIISNAGLHFLSCLDTCDWLINYLQYETAFEEKEGKGNFWIEPVVNASTGLRTFAFKLAKGNSKQKKTKQFRFRIGETMWGRDGCSRYKKNAKKKLKKKRKRRARSWPFSSSFFFFLFREASLVFFRIFFSSFPRRCRYNTIRFLLLFFFTLRLRRSLTWPRFATKSFLFFFGGGELVNNSALWTLLYCKRTAYTSGAHRLPQSFRPTLYRMAVEKTIKVDAKYCPIRATV